MLDRLDFGFSAPAHWLLSVDLAGNADLIRRLISTEDDWELSVTSSPDKFILEKARLTALRKLPHAGNSINGAKKAIDYFAYLMQSFPVCVTRKQISLMFYDEIFPLHET